MNSAIRELGTALTRLDATNPQQDQDAYRNALRDVADKARTVISESSVLTGWMDAIVSALEDAAEYRSDIGACPWCQQSPTGRCDEHSADEALADKYQRCLHALEHLEHGHG
jgi:hypothetical protein